MIYSKVTNLTTNNSGNNDSTKFTHFFGELLNASNTHSIHLKQKLEGALLILKGIIIFLRYCFNIV